MGLSVLKLGRKPWIHRNKLVTLFKVPERPVEGDEGNKQGALTMNQGRCVCVYVCILKGQHSYKEYFLYMMADRSVALS